MSNAAVDLRTPAGIGLFERWLSLWVALCIGAGVWLGIGHVVTAAGCFATIIGIPFGIQHLKLAMLALAPIGKTIVRR